MDLTRDLSWWESDRKWMKKLRKIIFFHLKHRVIFNEDLNCNLHRRGDRLIISQTNRSERIKALSEAFHADLSDFVPKLPFQYADSISRWPREANRKGDLLMNRASEGGGEVSWSLPGPEIWQLWEILQFSDKKGTRRCDWRRRTHLAISRKSTDLQFLQICSPFQVIECEQVVRWKLENHSTQKHKIMTLNLQKDFFL